jgi:hypothetical protein
VLIKCDKTDFILSALQIEANLYVEFKRVIGRFHEKLYKKQDCLKKVNLSTEIPYNDIPKLTENQKQSLVSGIPFGHQQ